jgi:uncharacterized protein
VQERDGYMEGVPCWIDTGQPDPQAAMEFYSGLFGWEFEDRSPPEAPTRYYVARLQGRDVGAIGHDPETMLPTPVWNTYIWADDADATSAKVKEAGGSVIDEPFAIGDAGRMAVCSDPGGAVFCVWEPSAHKGAQVVNEANSWNWSTLNTRDLEGAKAFYGAVFGWESETLPIGAGEATMCRVPGYGDFLEAGRDPDIRRRQSEGGAPPGFEDAIGWMSEMTSDQFADDVPPHWHVTFTVEDAQASAARVEELGGSMLVPVVENEWANVGVVRDPQGAVFSISQFDPK